MKVQSNVIFHEFGLIKVAGISRKKERAAHAPFLGLVPVLLYLRNVDNHIYGSPK